MSKFFLLITEINVFSAKVSSDGNMIISAMKDVEIL